jgi:hypothetical protein
MMLAKNFKDSLNNGAFVMQTLRSKMGGTPGPHPDHALSLAMPMRTSHACCRERVNVVVA